MQGTIFHFLFKATAAIPKGWLNYILPFLNTGNTMMCYLDLWCEWESRCFSLSANSKDKPAPAWTPWAVFFQGTSTHTEGSPGTAVSIRRPSCGLSRNCRTPPPPPETLKRPQGHHLCRGTQSTSSSPTAFPSGLKEPFITLFLSPLTVFHHWYYSCSPLCYQNFDTWTQYNYLLSKYLRSELFENILYMLCFGLCDWKVLI